MKPKWCVETYSSRTNITTLRYRGPLPLVVAYAALLFLPCLMVGSFVKIDSAKHWNDYDAFWSNYYAREGKSQQ